MSNHFFKTTIFKLLLPIVLITIVVAYVGAQYMESILQKQQLETLKIHTTQKNNQLYFTLENTRTILLQNLKDAKVEASYAEEVAKREALKTLKAIAKKDIQTQYFIVENTHIISLNNADQISEKNVISYLANTHHKYIKVEKNFTPWNWILVSMQDSTQSNDALYTYKKALIGIGLLLVTTIIGFLYFILSFVFNTSITKILKKLAYIQEGKEYETVAIDTTIEFQQIDKGINHMVEAITTREELLISQKERSYAILDSQPTIVIITDGKHMQEANQAFLNFFTEFADLEDFKKTHSCICDFFQAKDQQNYIINTKDKTWIDQILEKPDQDNRALIQYQNKEYVFSLNLNFLNNNDDTEQLYIVVLTDITDIIKQKEQLHKQLHVDELTDLPNRRSLFSNIKKNTIIYLLNIDGFKDINDYYGFHIGDDVLKQFSKKLLAMLPSKFYSLYKLTADEFAITYQPDELITEQSVDIIFHNIISKLSSQYIETQAYDFNINFTIGASSTYFVEPKELIASADIALKTAKKEKKLYKNYLDTQHVKEEYQERIKWTKILNFAIDNNDLIPFFQPIVDTKTGKIIKYEALIRLRYGDEIISPFFFLDIAKANRMYPIITKKIIDESVRTYTRTLTPISINITIEDIFDIPTKEYILDTLDQYREFASNVAFELVESEEIEDHPEINLFLQDLKSYGAKISIDDFGSGYSNFEYLLKLEVDYLKLDGSLIKNIDTDKNSLLLVTHITKIAHALGIEVIAEFVHSQDVYDVIKELNIEYSQGYFFGAPQII